MPLTIGSLFDTHATRIQEVLNRSIEFMLADLSPVWRDVIRTSFGVGSASDLGRDLKVIKLFHGSFTGVLEQGAPRNDFDLYGDDTDQFGPKLHVQNLNQTYPDPREGPNPTTYRLSVAMRSMPANIMITLGEKSLEALPATVGQVLAPKMMGFARMMAHTLCNYFYLSQNDQYRICTISNISAFTESPPGSGVYRFTFEPSNMATNRFARGQRIDIYAPTTNIRRNDTEAAAADQTVDTRIRLFVESVNALKNEITVIGLGDPATDWGAEPIDDDFVTYGNSRVGTQAFTGIAGINSWLKAGTGNPNDFEEGNTLLGLAESTLGERINVDLCPEFMSFLKAVNGVLTEHKLRQFLARIHAHLDPMGKFIDTLLAPDGVWLAYEAQKIGMFRIDRTDRLSSLRKEGSQKGFLMTFDGRDYMGHTDNIVEANTLYGIRRGGQNWKKYVPPSPRGTTSMAGVDAFVPFEFVAPALTGGQSNMLPIYSATGDITLPTEGSQMPGRIRMQMIPDQVNMMKLTGLTEDRIYGDTE
jgi:hypothetical protein